MKRHAFPVSLPVLLFLFLFAIYLLTYTPRINSSDGLAMFATAESLVRRRALDIEQIRWMDLQQGTYGLDGLLYSRKGIGVPIGLLPLTWLGFVIPWFGTVSVSLLFNAVVTALTAVILMTYLQKLGFHSRTSLIVALTFGLATLAWPYAKSLFSDPLAALLLLAAAFTLLKFRLTHQLRYSFLTGLFLGWNIATRYAEALFLPVYGLLLLYYLFDIYNLQFTIYDLRKFIIHPLQGKTSSFIIRSGVTFTAPILLIGAALITFNLSRYGDPTNTGYLPNETFSAVWWEGIIGQLVSPGRGLLLYSPILILSFWGLIPFFRHHRAEALLALSVIIIHLLLYGKWFMWHGGYAWGPRFMIPTLPFWCLFLAPVAAQAFPLNKAFSGQILRIAYLGLFLLSLIPQLLAVVIDFTPFQNSLLETGLPLFDRQTFFDPQYAAVFGAWDFISFDTLDLIWIWQGQTTWWLLGILLGNVIITGFYLMRKFRDLGMGQSPITNHQLLITNLLPYLSTFIAVISLLAYAHSRPSKTLQEAVAELNSAARPTDAIITNDPEIAMPFAELYKGRAPVLGLNHGGFPLPADVTRRLNEIRTQHAQIWWLPNWLPPEESAIEQTLLAQGFKTRDDNFSGQRLVLLATPPELPVHTINEIFGGSIRLISVAYPPNSITGAALPVELHWQATDFLTKDYHVFIHLLNDEGQMAAQADGQPVQWRRPTSTWAVGDMIVDRHGLWIPAGTTAGTYQLRIGLYHPSDGQRLQLSTGGDSASVVIELTKTQ